MFFKAWQNSRSSIVYILPVIRNSGLASDWVKFYARKGSKERVYAQKIATPWYSKWKVNIILVASLKVD
ncbi:hypothetical protein SAMN04488057_1255 [Cyclobacterium lianum]|uniref:Uncharacterized protein n=1 Tax=Cyclobacterium lianum TaxID=388280 RepID=A0A1M7QUI9_9BACT|nr:hypothetical protein SAMN04488057_1255 [Cyclobacterium lianum]